MKRILVLFLMVIVACKNPQKQVDQPIIDKKPTSGQINLQTPDELLGQLFVDVQLGDVFEDSKTFVDCIPKMSYDSIRANYEAQQGEEDFNLTDFVLAHFELPASISSDFKSDPNKTAVEHVHTLWPVLTRESDSIMSAGSLIPLPNPYIVPGGRFREVYYWDSYFTMLGLVESGEFEMIENMLDNFEHLIRTVGHIPNGNRNYYITRSQPPFFAQMVNLLAEEKGDEIYNTYRDALKMEYNFWMDYHDSTEQVNQHVVFTDFGKMNRYFDKGNSPRQESYREDYLQVQKTGGGEKMYRDLRSGAESGWDYSTRWFADGMNIETIETTAIIPVDLNALLYGLETILIKSFADDADYVAILEESRKNRVAFMSEKAWNADDGIFEDFNFVKNQRTGIASLATVYPLYFEMATKEQADAVAATIEKDFLKPGGVVSTLINSGEQWDAPNGWAPLQWMTIQGLRNYGHEELARTIAKRWVALNEKVYQNTGKFVEKYNVEDMSLEAGGGEYPVQDGFGWSNGVYLALKSYLDETQ